MKNISEHIAYNLKFKLFKQISEKYIEEIYPNKPIRKCRTINTNLKDEIVRKIYIAFYSTENFFHPPSP
jgi:hypothetical protein